MQAILEPDRLRENGTDTKELFIMIMDGVVLMLVGMLVVCLFLTLMVFVMKGQAIFFSRFAHWFPEEAPVKPVKRAVASAGAGASGSHDAEVALAVAIAKTTLKK